MNLDNCFKIGQIVKAHGIKGEVTAELNVEDAREYLDLESVFVEINHKLVPFFIDHISVSDKRAIIKFEDIDTVEDTALLLKRSLYLPFDQLSEDGEEDHFIYEEIIGFLVKDKAKGEIGVVKDFIERPGQDLLIVDYHGKEVFVPIDEAIILKVDRKKRILSVNLPDGLLEL